MDPLALLGFALSLGAVLAGQQLDGGHALSLLQPAAALIVFGGTLGATLVSVPRADLRHGLRLLRRVWRVERLGGRTLVEEFARLADAARKTGIVALEPRVSAHPDARLRAAMSRVVDGGSSAQIRELLENDAIARSERDRSGAQVFETAGGYAPTMGILGAVLGLIHVMENLADPTRLGAGIAVAFVATLYGVGLANLVLLPLAARARRVAELEAQRADLVNEGALAVHAGDSPSAVRDRLGALLAQDG